MEFLENPCPSSNSSSVEFSSLRSLEDSIRHRTPKSTLTSKIRHTRTLDPAKQPTFIRFIRSNTHVNTVLSDFDAIQSDYIPDLAVLKGKAAIPNPATLAITNNKELLHEFIKVREATDYELLEDNTLAKSNDFIKSLCYIKVAISELCRIVLDHTFGSTHVGGPRVLTWQ